MKYLEDVAGPFAVDHPASASEPTDFHVENIPHLTETSDVLE